MFNKLLLIFVSAFLVSCSVLQVSELDTNTGLLPISNNVVADVLVSKDFDLDSRKSLLLAGDNVTGPQIAKLNYFDKIISFDDLEGEIIRANLTDKIPSLNGLIGLNNAAKRYKPFMMIRGDVVKRDGKEYLQIKLIDAVDMNEIFVAERYLDYVWAGVNDQNTYYPLYNALFTYIREQSNEI